VPYQRQAKIGVYRIDFYIAPSIIIDIKGPHHDKLQQSLWDVKRLAYLERRGMTVYTFSSSEVYRSPGRYAQLIASEYKKLVEEKQTDSTKQLKK
jgi:very-short-patch-repair endonuclease